MFRPFKYIILGNSSVGKSSIMLRYLYENFRENNHQTIGVDFGVKTVYYQDDPIKVNIWDLAGQERYTTIIKSYFRNVEAILLVFDVNNRKSFEDLNHWYNLIKEEYDLEKKDEYLPIIFLVGNKCDIYFRNVQYDDIREFMENKKIDKYIETSAKTNFNIDEMFDIITKEVVENLREFGFWDNIEVRPIINLDDIPNGKNSYCCSYF